MKTKLLSALAISMALLASCSDDDNNTTEVNDGQVKFSSGIASSNLKVGGADGNLWEGNESIGIYMVSPGDTIVAEGARNILYTTTSTGATATFSSATPIYYPVDATYKVDFIAYHPHASVNKYMYMVDATDQSDQSAIDLMRAFNDNGGLGYNKTNGTNKVNLVFGHKLTKVIFNTTPDTDNGLTQSDLANMTVTIKGMKTKASYNIGADVLIEASPAVVENIPTKTTIAGTLYEAIVVPQSFTDGVVTVEFALNNAKKEVFVYAVPATTFASAEKHEFNVKVQRTGVLASGTINTWTPMGIVTGIAK